MGRQVGYKVLPSTKKKISKKLMGHSLSLSTRRKISQTLTGRVGANKGINFSAHHCEKLSKALTGRKLSKSHRLNVIAATKERWQDSEYKKSLAKKISISQKGKIFTEVHKLHIKQNTPRGSNHLWWKGGITPLRKAIRALYEQHLWIHAVKKRDGYRCTECFKESNLHVHHKIEMNKLFAQFLNEYDQFSPLEDRETLLRLAIKYKPFWDIDNGITLCIPCHKKVHLGVYNVVDTSKEYA